MRLLDDVEQSEPIGFVALDCHPAARPRILGSNPNPNRSFANSNTYVEDLACDIAL